ncbi:MAG: hypothetical protein AAF512_24515, partial [Pseudomonadota bacterium]
EVNAKNIETIAHDIYQQIEPYRHQVMSKIAVGQQNVPTATNQLEAIRWLARVSRHLEQVVRHLKNLHV